MKTATRDPRTPPAPQLQRRVLRVLSVAQTISAAAYAAAVSVGAFAVLDLVGRPTPWVGAALAMATVGAAAAAPLLSRVMLRRGRRPGLTLGYALAALGGVLAGTALELGWLPVFLLALLLFGAGQAANLLARYAATDLAAADARGRAMSLVVFASTFGAVAGPLLTGPATTAGQRLAGLASAAGPWWSAGALFAVAALVTALRLRPDPLAVAGGVAAVGDAARGRTTQALRLVARLPDARLAVTAMVVAQVVMVAVMAMTPVHLRLHGHESLSGAVVSSHIAGMYALTPLVGRWADRHGPRAALRAGALVLLAATALAASGAPLLLFPALWALGLGWSAALIGGSLLLGTAVPGDDRVAVQGTADLAMSLCGAVAGLASGFVHAAVGYHLLAAGAALAAGGLLAAIVYRAPTVALPPSPNVDHGRQPPVLTTSGEETR